MKKTVKVILGLVSFAILFTGCLETPESKQDKVAEPTVTEESLGLRKTDIDTEASTSASKTEYIGAAPGTSTNMQRAFQDAPPMIPHSVDGMLPIKISSNQCLSCHLPDMAKLVNATSIPESHFTNFRPTTYIIDDQVVKSGVVIENTSDAALDDVSIVEQGELVGARFNCTQCHAPQSQGNLAVENNFEADYTSTDGASSSSWSGTKLMEGIDTTK